jgi:hypothetical protein
MNAKMRCSVRPIGRRFHSPEPHVSCNPPITPQNTAATRVNASLRGSPDPITAEISP